MTELRPGRPPRDVVLDFVFDVQQDWLDQQVDQTGELPASRWHVKIPLKEIDDPAMRRRLRVVHRRLKSTSGTPTLAAPTDDVADLLDQVERWLVKRVLADEEADKPFEAEKAAWIEAHGSQRLRTAHSRGYKVNRTYASERAAIEYPEFWIDTGLRARWRERVDPSVAALELEGKVLRWIADHDYSEHAQIVWLVHPPPDLESGLEETGDVFEDQEAIAVFGYLGRYNLFLPLDPDLRRREPEPEADDDGA